MTDFVVWLDDTLAGVLVTVNEDDDSYTARTRNGDARCLSMYETAIVSDITARGIVAWADELAALEADDVETGAVARLVAACAPIAALAENEFLMSYNDDTRIIEDRYTREGLTVVQLRAIAEALVPFVENESDDA